MTDKEEIEIRKKEIPNTIFIDIDGTLLKHYGADIAVAMREGKAEILPGVKEKFEEWYLKGYNIILTTGRRESMRAITVEQLSRFGIIYDILIMGIGGGSRYIINDTKPNNEDPTCFGITVKRNTGLGDLDV